jgi:hypothetical protein
MPETNQIATEQFVDKRVCALGRRMASLGSMYLATAALVVLNNTTPRWLRIPSVGLFGAVGSIYVVGGTVCMIEFRSLVHMDRATSIRRGNFEMVVHGPGLSNGHVREASASMLWHTRMGSLELLS